MATPQPDGTSPQQDMPPPPGMPPQGGAYPPPYQSYYPYSVYAPMPYVMTARPQLPVTPRAIWSMILGIVGIVGGFLVGYILLLFPGSTFASTSGSSSIFEYFTIAEVLTVVVPLAISVVAVVLGHSSLTQIRRGMTGGQGYAIAGLVLGYVGIGLRVAGVALEIALFAIFYHHI